MNNEKTMIFRHGGDSLEEAEREKRMSSEAFMNSVRSELETWQQKFEIVRISVNGDKNFPTENIEGQTMELLFYRKKAEPKRFSMVFEWAEACMAKRTTPVKYVFKDPILGVVFMITASGSCYINITQYIWGRKNPDVSVCAVNDTSSFEVGSPITVQCIGRAKDSFHAEYQRAYKIEGVIEDMITLPGMSRPSILLLNSGIFFLI